MSTKPIDDYENEPRSMDDMFNDEVDLGAAKETTKRNQLPQGTYLTSEEYEGTMTPKVVKELGLDREEIGERKVASIFRRATATIKGEDYTTFLRFDLSPETRKKKVYEGSEWTGDYDDKKDDRASILWADAVRVYTETTGGEPKRQSDVLNFLTEGIYGARLTVMGDRVIVLNLSTRKPRRG